MTAELSVRCLTRRYQRSAVTALDGLDLDVPAGGCLALLGPSGSGKTTALRLLAGLEEPDDGHVLVDGVDLRGVPPERRGMAMVFQRPLLLPHLSVLDNVAFSGRARGWSRARARTEARRHLELVQMLPLADRRVSALSGGQEQRVALARALAAEPRVLLLDEPFAALDPALREQMHDLVRALRGALQPTIVVVTHDRDEAAALADAVAVIDAGRVHQVGSVAELVRAPRTLTVARAMGARSILPGTLRAGRHHSRLGALDVTEAAPGVPDGPAWLVLRQELVHVVAAGAGQCTGTVVDRRTVGVRLQVSVAVSDGSAGASQVVHVELPPGRVVEMGTSVGLRFPADALSVVTQPTCTVTATGGDAAGNGSIDRIR